MLVKVFADGSVNLTMGASDIGTGTKSVMAMVVSEELGIRPEFVQIEHADTGTTQYATPSGGSKTVPTESPAVRAAAIDARRQLLEMASEDLGVPAAQLRMEAGEVTTKDGKRLAIPKIERLKKRQAVVGVGYREPNPEGKVVNPFAAQFCEVEVNILTGELRIVRFLGAHDSGRVMNRLTFDNQIFGGIVMGIGYATTEERVLDRGQTGKMLNRNWHDYKLPTALDVPSDMTTVAVDPGDQEANTVGAKGLGEPATIPTAAAIANAIYHATGVRVTDTPVNPVQLEKLHVRPEDDPTRETVLAPDEVLTAIHLPAPAGGLRSSYRKVRARRSWDFALAGLALAVVMEGQKVVQARAALSGVAPVPWRSVALEGAIVGKVLDDATIRQAAQAAVADAKPRKHNGYKVRLVRGVVTEELGAIRSV